MHGAVVTVVMCARMQNALHQFRSVLTLCTNRITKEPNGIQIYHFTINYTISLSSAPFSIFAILSATANWKQLQEKYVSKVIVSFSLSLSPFISFCVWTAFANYQHPTQVGYEYNDFTFQFDVIDIQRLHCNILNDMHRHTHTVRDNFLWN